MNGAAAEFADTIRTALADLLGYYAVDDGSHIRYLTGGRRFSVVNTGASQPHMINILTTVPFPETSAALLDSAANQTNLVVRMVCARRSGTDVELRVGMPLAAPGKVPDAAFTAAAIHRSTQALLQAATDLVDRIRPDQNTFVVSGQDSGIRHVMSSTGTKGPAGPPDQDREDNEMPGYNPNCMNCHRCLTCRGDGTVMAVKYVRNYKGEQVRQEQRETCPRCGGRGGRPGPGSHPHS